MFERTIKVNDRPASRNLPSSEGVVDADGHGRSRNRGLVIAHSCWHRQAGHVQKLAPPLVLPSDKPQQQATRTKFRCNEYLFFVTMN